MTVTPQHVVAPASVALVPVLRRAAVRAARAPSVHNTQPWRFVVRADHLELHIDRARQVPAYDPLGRQLLMSCGCALFNMRVALAHAGFGSDVVLLPAPGRPQILATVAPVEAGAPLGDLGALDAVIETRRTNRGDFTSGLDATTRHGLVRAAALEDALLVPVGDGGRATFCELTLLAHRMHNADPAYRAELRAWTVSEPDRVDGVPGGRTAFTQLAGADQRPAEGPADLLVLCSEADDLPAWVRAGEALERVLLEAAALGLATRPMTPVIEIPDLRSRLRTELGLPLHPQLVLQVGHAPRGVMTRRRRLVDVITQGS